MRAPSPVPSRKPIPEKQRLAKTHGIHYTPPDLAAFLATQTLKFARSDEIHRVLDPACGDGGLLYAVAAASDLKRLRLVGLDRDELAVEAARARLAHAPVQSLDLLTADFVEIRPSDVRLQPNLFDSGPNAVPASLAEPFDLVIANPPYVRTQVLGSITAQNLADEYNLRGRVDLYHVFVSGMTAHLRPEGLLGLLCSNRFLTTQSGHSLRQLLSQEFDLLEIFDLGDTRLFSAAVLPAILIARKNRSETRRACNFSRVYEHNGNGHPAKSKELPILAALGQGLAGLVQVGDSVYEIERGRLVVRGESSSPWTLSSPERDEWLATVERHTVRRFSHVGAIRVGIKTTADEVFIRSDWAGLPEQLRPEPELLRPLLTHHVARKWRSAGPQKQVLYPHYAMNGRKATVDLGKFPHGRAYLESHRPRLESRNYVVANGRQWFEIHVAQNPESWPKPKIVFPDISDEPRFFLDTSGAIVNGDCYWIAIDDAVPLKTAYLMLAVANSPFVLKFYDAISGNRLYAGRLRFMTQYVERFPIPRDDTVVAEAIVDGVERLLHSTGEATNEVAQIEENINRLVRAAFGLGEEISR